MPDTAVRIARKSTASKLSGAAFLAGGGEMGRRMRALDWSRTPLGATERWTASLRATVRILLTSRQPMFLFWGERMVSLYNDAAKGVVSLKHPNVLGQPASSSWHELWGAIGPKLESLRGSNEAGYEDATFLPVESAGASEAVRFAISYSPVPDDDGGPGGVLCVLNETEALHEAILGLSSNLDAQSLLQKLTDVATRITKARFGAFFHNTNADDGGPYPLFAVSGVTKAAFEKSPLGRATALFGATFRGEPAMRVDDVTKDARFGQMGLHDVASKSPCAVRSFLLVPVTSAAGEIIGTLLLAHPEAGVFTERAERHTRVLAAHAGVAIDNANLFGVARREIEERSRVEIALRESEQNLASARDELAAQIDALTRLHEMATRLAALDDTQAALDAVLETAIALQAGDFGLIHLYDRSREALVLRASAGFDNAALGSMRELGPAEGSGAWGACFEQMRRIAVVDTETDPTFGNLQVLARDAGFRSVHCVPIVTRDGTLLGVLSVYFREPAALAQRAVQLAEVCARHAADAIQHHRGREALRDSERLYRAIGESINYGVWVCDENGRTVYVSESFLKLTGLQLGNYEKEIWSTILHPDDAPRVRQQWIDCIASGRDWEAEVRVRSMAGGYRAILSRGVAIRDAENRITGWAGMNLDIDRLKRVEDELRELDQRKNEFLATLAHELRNPLAPIRNGLEIMRLGRGNAGMVEQARTMMERQLHHMIRLVDDLLDVSRVSRGKIELRKERMDLSKAIANAIETAKPLIDQNGQTLVAELADTPMVVEGDLTRLSQVFTNLLNNAAKYTEKGGRIEVSVKNVGPALEARVKDEGIGIPTDMLESIFGIFTQVDRSLEKARGGLGIGLSIARRLAEMHGGTIVARSAGPGKGSEFVVTLPVDTSGLDPSEHRRAAAGLEGAARRRVLIADDNFDSASSLSIMLQVMGNEVRVAHDGLEALRIAEGFRPDAILLDIGMPGMNGYEVCRRLRERSSTAKTTIVALTGWGQEEDRLRSRESGFDRHLVKPVEPSTLESLLAGLPVSQN